MEVRSRYRSASAASVRTISIRFCVQHIDISCEPADTTTRKLQQHCFFQHRGGVLGGNLVIAELAANSQHLSKSLNRQRVPLCSAGRHDGDKERNYSRIEPIAFRQNSAGFGKLPQLDRIDPMHCHIGREQSSHDAALETSARFETNRRKSKDRAAA
jgi:hypothetical protein